MIKKFLLITCLFFNVSHVWGMKNNKNGSCFKNVKENQKDERNIQETVPLIQEERVSDEIKAWYQGFDDLRQFFNIMLKESQDGTQIICLCEPKHKCLFTSSYGQKMAEFLEKKLPTIFNEYNAKIIISHGGDIEKNDFVEINEKNFNKVSLQDTVSKITKYYRIRTAKISLACATVLIIFILAATTICVVELWCE